MGIDFGELLKSKEELEEKLEKTQDKSLKQEIKKYLPEPMQEMLDTQEGTYLLIALAIILAFIAIKVVGFAFNFLLKIGFILAIIVAAYFGYVYFFSNS
ncbi:MAG: hypothetical protein GXO22_06670 [Aquificae bacterium]|nr:hypothetical protein [Aquificota bacterium]